MYGNFCLDLYLSLYIIKRFRRRRAYNREGVCVCVCVCVWGGGGGGGGGSKSP